jgi:hypothetical protein
MGAREVLNVNLVGEHGICPRVELETSSDIVLRRTDKRHDAFLLNEFGDTLDPRSPRAQRSRAAAG